MSLDNCLLGGIEHNKHLIMTRNKLYHLAESKGFIGNAINIYELVLKKQLRDNQGLPEWYSKTKALEYLRLFVED